MFSQLVVVRGGGDLGSGVAVRLWRSGFPVVILECEQPVAVRRTVAFSEAVYDGTCRVEEVTGRLVSSVQDIEAALKNIGPAENSPVGATPVGATPSGGPPCAPQPSTSHRRDSPLAAEIPVLVDLGAASLSALAPYAVVDAIMAKRNTGTRIDMAPFVVALGPGFTAGQDAHAIVETNRGPSLGRVIWSGAAEPNTGEPGAVAGKTSSRVLRAAVGGTLRTVRAIGDIVEEGEVVATVEGLPIRASFRSLVRGLARDGLSVEQGMKIGDIDPRLDPMLCRLISDKALAIGGGVLEAILYSLR